METDLRILKTRNALLTAFLGELNHNSFEDITITGICNKAQVRRATFYNHFEDKYDLLAYCIRHTLKQFARENTTEVTYETFLLNFAEDSISFLTENTDLILSLEQSHLMPLLYSVMFQEVKQELQSCEKNFQFEKSQNKHTINLFIYYHFEGVLGAIRWWIEENQPISKEELIKEVMDIIKNGF